MSRQTRYNPVFGCCLFGIAEYEKNNDQNGLIENLIQSVEF